MKNEKSIENQAVNLVKKYYKKLGKKCWDVKNSEGCDLRDQDGRLIEVKGRSKSDPHNQVHIYDSIFKYLKRKDWGDRAYNIYIVYDINKSPKLWRLTPKDLRGCISEPIIRVVNIKKAINSKIRRGEKPIHIKK